MERLRLVIFQVLGALLLLTMPLSCSEEGLTSSPVKTIAFSASYGSDEARTVLSESVRIHWEDGDAIYVSGSEEPFVTSLTEPSATAEFTGETAAAEIYYAVYPYSAVSDYADQIVIASLPSIQDARKGSFDQAANISVSSTTDQDKNFVFHHAVGYLRFTIGESSGKVTSLTVQAPGGEALSGSFYVDCTETAPELLPDEGQPYVKIVSETSLEAGDYYIAMLPGVYSEGLSFTK